MMNPFKLFGWEKRASIEDPSVPISNQNIITFLGLGGASAAGEVVTIDSALGVPAVWAAVNFIPGTLAGLPLDLFKRTGEGRKKQRGGLATILHDAVNDGMSSFEWRKYIFQQVLTGGRGLSFIERKESGQVSNIWPLDPSRVTIKWSGAGVGRRKLYEYRDGKRTVRYEASEIIDLVFMLKADMLSHRSPILSNKDTIGRAQAIIKYGSRFFQNGGVPPFVIEGPIMSPGAMERAGEQLTEAVRKAAKEERLALVLPDGHKLTPIGVDPEKAQLVETNRFIIEEIARIYSLPPTFLQDLTHGTFSNTEQQDLHFVKHTIKRWVEQFEQEMNLKLFGRFNTEMFVELNVDGLLRGDFKTRMEGHAKAVQNALLTPNEVRRRENQPDDPKGDTLLIQGATVPLGSQPLQPPKPPGSGDDK